MSYMPPPSSTLDAETVIARLEEAGKTLLALPGKGCFPAQEGSSWPAVVHAAVEAYGYGEEEVRPPVPSAQAITRMDEALAWVTLIPDDRRVHRRIVLLRSLIHPVRDKHVWGWRKIGKLIGSHHQAVQLWHSQAVDMIVSAVNRKPVRRAKPILLRRR